MKMYRLLTEDDVTISRIDPDKLVVCFRENMQMMNMPRSCFEDHFWRILEEGAIITWSMYSWNGKVSHAFRVRFPWLKGR